MDLNLLQRDVAAIIGVDTTTVFNWETQGMAPNLRALPKVIEFLGYDPRSSGQTIGEKLRRHREGLGLSWAEAAKVMGVDPSTVSKWERQSDERHDHRSIPNISRFLGCSPLATPNSLGAYIRHTRYLAGLRLAELGKRLGVCAEVVSRLEQNMTCPSAEQLELIKEISSDSTTDFRISPPVCESPK
jgi:transcriptional regulator with XRE-family HTH domain